MTKTPTLILAFFICFSVKSQTLKTQRIPDWGNLKLSGFYETLGGANLPTTANWHWGINIGHGNNTNTTDKYSYGAQIVFPLLSAAPKSLPVMYIRNTNEQGEGQWAKVLIDRGTQSIDGKLGIGVNNPAYSLDVNGITRLQNTLLPLGSRLTIDVNSNFTYKGKPIGHYAIDWEYDT